MPQRPQTISTI